MGLSHLFCLSASAAALLMCTASHAYAAHDGTTGIASMGESAISVTIPPSLSLSYDSRHPEKLIPTHHSNDFKFDAVKIIPEPHEVISGTTTERSHTKRPPLRTTQVIVYIPR